MTHLHPSQLPPQLHALVESELQEGERITWLEQPIPGQMARSMLPVVLFGIPWTAIVLVITGGAATVAFDPMAGTPWEGTGIAGNVGIWHTPGWFALFPLIGVPFILVGLGMLSSPYWAYRAARRSAYVLTDCRAIVFSRDWFNRITIRSFPPERLTELHRKQRADGSGDLVFAQESWRDDDGHRRSRDIGFLAIREVKAVEALVRALARSDR